MSTHLRYGSVGSLQLLLQPGAAWVEPLNAYLGWMRSAQRSPGTIKQHSYALRRFAADTLRDPYPVTVEQLAQYLGERGELSPAALRSKRQALRGFYSWGQLVGRWPDNPARQLPVIRALVGVPRPAPEHSVRVGLQVADQRVRIMMMLGVQVGMRCREICLVATSDLQRDFVGWSLLVHGKGGRNRMVPIPDDLAAYIRRHDEGFLFPGLIDGHLSAAYVSKLISRALPPGVTAHQLRHRYGTRAYQLGGRDLRAVQVLLGHASVATTQIYVAVEDDAVRRAAMAAAAS